MVAKLLDQIGLMLGFISGILLIPEVINFFPLEKFQKSIENGLIRFENWARFPLGFGPPSWKKFRDEEREAIERKTAIRTLIFSLTWMAILARGIVTSSTFLIGLVIGILMVIALGHIVVYLPLWQRLSPVKFVIAFIGLFFGLMVVTPLFSLVRVVMLILRSIVSRMHSFFAVHDILRTSLTVLAIILFIISNILQFIATFL
jgi:hypothetical protein